MWLHRNETVIWVLLVGHSLVVDAMQFAKDELLDCRIASVAQFEVPWLVLPHILYFTCFVDVVQKEVRCLYFLRLHRAFKNLCS